MNIIYNVSYNKDKTILKLHNINASIANAIRRIIISEIKTIGFDDNLDSIHILKNTTSYHNEYLSHRISMIPLYISKIDDFDIEKYKFVIDKKNTHNENLYITTQDFKVFMKDDKNEWIITDETKFFKPDKISKDYILICKLNDNISELNIECKASIYNGNHNSHFSPVSTCVLINEIDPDIYKEKLDIYLKDCLEEKKEEMIKDFDLSESEKCFSLDEKREPNTFQLIFETIGILSSTDIFIGSLIILENKMNIFNFNIQEDKLSIDWSNKVKFKAIDIIIPNEDDTLGNLLQFLIYDSFMNDKISYIGYDKEHPLDEYLILRIVLINDNTEITFQKEEIKKIVSHIIDKINIYISQLKKDWYSYSKKKITVKKS